MRMLTFLTLLMVPTAALAAEEADVSPTVGITVDAKTEHFLPLKSGSTLTFDTPGPQGLLVISRRRMAGAGQRAKTAPIEARGDGHPIMTIAVSGTAIPSGRIHDRMEGFPSKQDKSVITVPEGGKQLTLTAPPGGPDFFVHVSSRDRPDVLILPIGAAPAAAAVAAATAPAEAPRSGEPKEDPQAAEEDAPPPGQAKPATPQKAQELKPGVGVELGLGIPARGTSLVTHVGLTGRYPVYRDLLSVGGSIGWHRITVEEQVNVVHPMSGNLEYSANWRTSIVPIQARATVHVPYSAGPIVPIASAGLGLFIATRTDESGADGPQTATKLAVGPELAVGCEIEIDVGLLQTTVSWSEARASLGNRGVDGEPVAETFALTSLYLSYLYTF
jgi:hypothetical protein